MKFIARTYQDLLSQVHSLLQMGLLSFITKLLAKLMWLWLNDGNEGIGTYSVHRSQWCWAFTGVVIEVSVV